MVKHYCDICGEPCGATDSERIEGAKGRLSFKIVTAIDLVWNGGDVCHACIIKAVIEVAK
jgi:hypothetical protein